MKATRMEMDKAPVMDDEVDYRALFGVLRRQVKLIFVVASVIMVAALLYAYSRTPIYTAAALVQVEPQGQDVLASGAQSQNFGVNDIRVDGEVEIMRSDAVARRVVEAGRLQDDPEFGGAGMALKEVIDNLRAATEVVRKGQTYLVAVRVSAETPTQAARLSNVTAQAYIDHQIEAKVASLHAVAEVLRRRLLIAAEALGASEAVIDGYISENLSVAGRTDLAGLNAQVLALAAQSEARRAEAASLTAALAREDWPEVVKVLDLQGELAEIDAELAAQAQARLAGVQNEVATLSAAAATARANLRSTALEGDLPPEMLAQIYGLQQEAAIARGQYDSFLFRLREVEMLAEVQVAGAWIVSPALAPLVASGQSRRALLALAAVFALLTGLGLGFINEYVVGGFTTAGQLANGLRLKVVAEVPAVHPMAADGAEASAAQVMVAQPMGAFGESIRRLRMALDRADNRQGRVVMMTSTLPGEGKSNTCLALGRAYAASGVRCLLVDCDLRHPQIHLLAGIAGEKGLLQYFESNATGLAGWVQPDRGSALQILPGAGRSQVPTDDMLAGKRFAALLAQARQEYDVIFLDTPPLHPVVDGLHLAGQADVIVLAVKWASTMQRDVRAVLPALEEAKRPDVPVLAMLSQVQHAGRGYGRKYANYYQ